MNLKSSVNEMGETVTQIFHFKDGQKKTIDGIITSSIKESTFTQFKTTDGRKIYINPNNVNLFEVF